MQVYAQQTLTGARHCHPGVSIGSHAGLLEESQVFPSLLSWTAQ